MRSLFIGLILFVSSFGVELAASRPGAWRMERVPGSARLSLGALRYIVLPVEANERLVAAAEDLRRLFGMRYGVEPEILTDGLRRPKQAVFLNDPGVRSYGLDVGGFLIYRDGMRLFVAGDSVGGIVNGAYALCTELLGARWYWPGEVGLEFVGEPISKFPDGRWREEPSYTMRSLHPVDGDFGRRNRLVSNFQFNHALAKVFSPALYDVEPEVFSMVNGRRRKPRGNAGLDPQPDFTRPRTVELSAQAALAHFEKNPGSQSFSLSINDNVLFDQSEATRAAVVPLEYFRGRPNYTDLVFGFMNAVAAQVFDEGGAWMTPSGQPRYITALAYYWTEQSPSFQLHPRIMPVLTSDRAQWHDPAYRAEDKALIKRWAASGVERVATWDYYFGAPYPYPRQFNAWIAESLAFMHTNGVSVFFTQMPATWGLDGAKGWLTARLLWDASADAGLLLDEYYTHFFGAAAGPVRRFYELAEAHRNTNAGKADWIKFYKDEAGIELFDEAVLRELRELVEQATAAVVDDPRRSERVAVVSGAFAFTEAAADCQRARVRVVQCALDALSQERAVDPAVANSLEALWSVFRGTRTVSETLLAELVKNPLHSRLSIFGGMRQSDPASVVLAAMAHVGGAAAHEGGEPEAVLAGVAQRWAQQEGAFRSTLANVNLEHAEAMPDERDFLGPAMPHVAGWHFDFRASEHLTVGAAEGSKLSGVRVAGADMFSIFRDIPVIPEKDYLLDASLAYRISPDNRTSIKFTWTDRDGRRLRTDTPIRFPTGDSAGACRIAVPMHAPPRAYTLRVHFLVSRQYAGDFLELQKVDLGLILN